MQATSSHFARSLRNVRALFNTPVLRALGALGFAVVVGACGSENSASNQSPVNGGAGGEGAAGASADGGTAGVQKVSSCGDNICDTDESCTTCVHDCPCPCGDSIRQGVEQCDGADLTGQSCVSLGYDGGDLACDDACGFDTTGCVGEAPACGDSVAEGLEECDLADTKGATCGSNGFEGGTLACAADCLLDTSACTGQAPICGDQNAMGLEECDGVDLRLLDCTDFGFTSGTLACDASCKYVTGGCTGGSAVLCGDNVAAGTEACDGTDLRGLDCAALGYTGGVLGCRPECTRDTSACTGTAAVCSDGIKNGIEDCDGADLGGQNCVTLGFTGGTLGCDATCTFDPSACTVPIYDLDGATGCEGVYNPDQILDYELTGNWAQLLAEPGDGTSTLVLPFEFSCNGGAPIQVAVERKRGGGTNRIGFKVDFNEYVIGQHYYGLKKLVFDNSVGCCDADDASHDSMIREYLTWRMMALSGVIAGRAVFANLYVNGELIGVMLNVENVDKTFLSDRFGDNDGWLYKRSGGPGDGLKTNETCVNTTCPNPYKDYFCFWPVEGGGCSSPPADVASTLPDHLMLDQMLRFGAVNAIAANSDGPIFKDNNYYVYDWPGKRAYIPWDLDTSMKETTYAVFAGGNSSSDTFVRVLFPTWDADFAALVGQLIATPLSVASVHAEADRLLTVAGASIDADPYHPEPAADLIATVKSWWETRHGNVTLQLAAH